MNGSQMRWKGGAIFSGIEKVKASVGGGFPQM